MSNERRSHRPASRTFCVAAAGFRPNSPLCDKILRSPFVTPTLHIVGRTDVVVAEERSKKLHELTLNRRVEYHYGGEDDLVARSY